MSTQPSSPLPTAHPGTGVWVPPSVMDVPALIQAGRYAEAQGALDASRSPQAEPRDADLWRAALALMSGRREQARNLARAAVAGSNGPAWGWLVLVDLELDGPDAAHDVVARMRASGAGAAWIQLAEELARLVGAAAALAASGTPGEPWGARLERSERPLPEAVNQPDHEALTLLRMALEDPERARFIADPASAPPAEEHAVSVPDETSARHAPVLAGWDFPEREVLLSAIRTSDREALGGAASALGHRLLRGLLLTTARNEEGTGILTSYLRGAGGFILSAAAAGFVLSFRETWLGVFGIVGLITTIILVARRSSAYAGQEARGYRRLIPGLLGGRTLMKVSWLLAWVPVLYSFGAEPFAFGADEATKAGFLVAGLLGPGLGAVLCAVGAALSRRAAMRLWDLAGPELGWGLSADAAAALPSAERRPMAAADLGSSQGLGLAAAAFVAMLVLTLATWWGGAGPAIALVPLGVLQILWALQAVAPLWNKEFRKRREALIAQGVWGGHRRISRTQRWITNAGCEVVALAATVYGVLTLVRWI